ncbi:SusC/RagA family TonB-linked outer membrane protein [Polaribacter butkevichii]|nr:TonB-dependent receptor [Polaribacter butkevichii]
MEIKLTNILFSEGRKLLLIIMKTFILLFCATVFGFTPNNVLSQNAKIKIDKNQTITVDEVFDIIMKQTDYTFIYQVDMFKGFPSVTLNKGKIRANDLLLKSLTRDKFNFELTNKNTIVITNKPSKSIVQEPIKGQVTEESGGPLPGVTILIKRNKRGTTTDIDGNYKIAANIGDVLVFQYLGKKNKEVEVTSKEAPINIVLKPDDESLEEVVVVGYGSVRKKDVTGSVSSISTAEIANITPTTFEQAIAAKAPGVFVKQTTGRPGEGIVINIRGVSSVLGYNQPLYVIDGIPIDTHPNYVSGYSFDAGIGSRGNPLASIDPDDIQSIDILKDASSAAIYGSRAANGVVIVTTKRGRKNQKPTISINSSLTIDKPLELYDVLSADEYKANLTIAAQNFSGNNSLKTSILNDPNFFQNGNTNWQKQITRSAMTKNFGLGISGGSEKSIYSFNLNLSDQEGIIDKTGFKRYNIRTNIETNFTKNFKVGTNLNFTNSLNYGSSGLFAIQDAIRYRPDYSIYQDNGSFNNYNGDPNPVATSGKDSKRHSNSLLGNIFAEVDFIPELTFRTQLNASLYLTESNFFNPPTASGNDDATRTERNGRTFNTTFDNTLTYKKLFNDKHAINALVGASFYKTEDHYSRIGVEGFANYEQINNIGSANDITSAGGGNASSGLVSYFTRLNYNFDSRYYATFTFRADESSKFGPNNRWGKFPSGALAWNISNESFMKSITWVDNLKLRTSYGLTGLANVSDFLYDTFFGAGYSYDGLNGIAPLGLPNPDIRWQKTKQLDVAIDFSFFDARLNGTVGYFTKRVEDLLMNRPVQLELGYNSQSANVGIMDNKGIEFQIDADIIRTQDFTFNTSFNFTSIQNKIIDLEGGFPFSTGGTSLVEEGQPLGTIRGYRVEGIFQTQDEIDALNNASPTGKYQSTGTSLGDYKFRDLNEDGVITSADTEVLGSIQPDFFGGLTTTFQYKSFSLSTLWQYSYGNSKVWEAAGILKDIRNVIKDNVQDAWSPTNIDGTRPRLVLNDPNNNDRRSDAFVHDASFVRLKNVRLGYTLPKGIIKKINANNINIYMSLSNLLTFTKYPGLDPETSRDDGRQSFFNYTDADEYPLSRNFVFGINVQL